MTNLRKTKAELINELKELQQKYVSLKTTFNKEEVNQKQKKQKLDIPNKEGTCLTDQTEQTLENNEEIYKFMFDNNPQPMWIFDTETNVFLEINNAAILHYGYSREEFLSMTINDIRPDEDINLLLKTKHLSGNLNFVGEWRHLKKNGDIIIVEIIFNSLIYKGREARHVIVNDITDRKKAEELLKQSEEKFSSAFYTSPAAMTIAKLSDGLLVDVNNSFLEMFEYKREEVIGYNSTEINLIDPEERAKTIQKIEETGGLNNFELKLKSKSGKNKDLIVSSKPIIINGDVCTLNTLIDITNRKQVEQALKKSEEEFRSLAESMPQIVWATRADGWNTYFNQQWTDYTGLTLEESYGHGWNIPFHPEDQQRSWDAWQNAVNNNDTYSIEVRLRRFDGEYRWWLIRGVPVLNEKGEILKWFGTCTYIEDIIQAENQLKEYTANLKSLIDNRKDSIWSLDQNYNYLIFNKFYADAFYNEYNYNVEKGMCALDTLTPEASEFWLPKYKLAFAGEPYVFGFEHVIEGKNHYYQVSLNPIFENGLVTGVSAISVEITETVLAQEEIKASEKKFKTVFETSNVGKSITLTTGEINVNQAFCNILGYTNAELQNKTWQEITPEDEIPKVEKILEPLLNGKNDSARFEKRYICKNGDLIWADVSVSIQRDENKNPLYFITAIVDISETKGAKINLLASEHRYRMLFENMNVGFVLFEVVQNEKGIPIDLTIIVANEKFEETTGLKLQQVIGKQLTKVLPGIENDKADWIGTYGKIAMNGGAVHFDEPSEILGHHYNVNAYQSAPNHCAVTFLDITDRKKAEEKLQKNETRLLLALEAAKLGTWDLDLITGQAIRSVHHDEIFGYEELQTEWNLEIALRHILPEDRQKVQDAHTPDSNNRMSVEARILKQDGSIGWINSRGLFQYDAEGRPIRIIGVVLDITERKLAEITLKESEKEFKLLAESMPQIVWTTTADGLNTYFNQQWVDYTGLSLEESYGNGWNKPFHPDDQQKAWEAWQNAVNNNGIYSIEARLRKADGTYRWWLVRGMPILNEKNEILKWFGTCTDIHEMKIAAEIIQKQKKDFQTIIDSAPIMIAFKDINNKFLEVNSAFANYFELPINQIIGKQPFEIVTQQEITQEARNQDLEIIRTGKPIFNQLIKWSGKNKEKDFWSLYSKVPFYDKDGKCAGIITYTVDVNDRILAEEALQESEKKYKGLYNSIRDAILVADNNRKIIDCNMAFTQLFGYSIDEIKGKPTSYVYGNLEQFNELGQAIKDNSSNNNPFSYTVNYKKKNGKKFPGETGVHFLQNSAGEVQGFIGIIRDISEQLVAEKALKESDELLRLSTELANVAAWEMDLVTNSMTRSRNHDNLYGLKDVGVWKVNTFLDATHIDDREKCNLIINNSIAPGGPDEYKFDFRIYYPDQSIHWLNVIGVIIARDSNGVGTKIRGFITDITDRKQAEEELNRLNIELEKRVFERTKLLDSANKELQTFTYSVSHDLKAPLRGIDGYSNLLQELYAADLNEEAQSFIHSIRKGTKQMNMLIGDLLDYSRLERASLRVESINSIEFLKMIKSQFETEISSTKCDFTIKAPDIEIVADIRGLTIALRNLIENAIKFSSGQKKPAVEISLKNNTNNWLLAVKDNGIGIDMKYKERIFEIFQQLNLPEDFPGTGIGLAMVNKAAEKMGGKVWAESKLGIGSEFYFEVPKKTI